MKENAILSDKYSLGLLILCFFILLGILIPNLNKSSQVIGVDNQESRAEVSKISKPELKAASFSNPTFTYNTSGDLGNATKTTHCSVGININNLAPLISPSATFLEDSGATYSSDEVALWRDRYYSNSYMRIKGDVFEGSPDNMTDIIKDAESQIINPEPYVEMREEGGTIGSNYGFKIRDASFMYLITREDKYLNAAKQSLFDFFASTQNSKTFFDTACFRVLDGTAPKDAYFGHAALIARLATSYDYIRSGLDVSERLMIENALRRYAYFFSTHFDWGVGGLFPSRLSDDYSVRGRNADDKATSWPKYVTERVDTNNDCKIDSNDSPDSYDMYTHIDESGNSENKISVVSQYFNNRRSNTLVVVGIVGGLLSDKLLIDRSERGIKEWLKYAVYSDGTEGEYARNGDYCIPHQGRIYAMSNINAALVVAEVMSRRGDDSLYNYSTRDGLYDTESSSGDDPKSINNYLKNYFDLISKKKNIYYYEPWKSVQEPREQTHLGRILNGYMNGNGLIHNWHDLSLLRYANKFNNTEWSKIILRNADTGMPSLITNPSINSGVLAYKDHGTSDTMAAYPSMLFMYTPRYVKEVTKYKTSVSTTTNELLQAPVIIHPTTTASTTNTPLPIATTSPTSSNPVVINSVTSTVPVVVTQVVQITQTTPANNTTQASQAANQNILTNVTSENVKIALSKTAQPTLIPNVRNQDAKLVSVTYAPLGIKTDEGGRIKGGEDTFRINLNGEASSEVETVKLVDYVEPSIYSKLEKLLADIANLFSFLNLTK